MPPYSKFLIVQRERASAYSYPTPASAQVDYHHQGKGKTARYDLISHPENTSHTTQGMYMKFTTYVLQVLPLTCLCILRLVFTMSYSCDSKLIYRLVAKLPSY